MKIERCYGYDEYGKSNKSVVRILDTTCPKCKQHVEFALQEDEFVREDNKNLREHNDSLIKEIDRLNKIINKILNN